MTLLVWALACVAAFAPAASGEAPAKTWHEDLDAGIAFPVPFPDPEPKTPGQVRGLILDNPGAKIPADVEYTSGLYSKPGVPFILVWRQPGALPTMDQVDALERQFAGETRARYGLSTWVFDPPKLRGIGEAKLPDGLRVKLVAQITDVGASFVGYYYRDVADEAAFASLTDGFKVLPERRLHLADLPRGPLLPARGAVTALACVLAAVAAYFWQKRDKARR